MFFGSSGWPTGAISPKDKMSGTPVGAIGRCGEFVDRPTAVRGLRNRRRCTRIGACEHGSSRSQRSLVAHRSRSPAHTRVAQGRTAPGGARGCPGAAHAGSREPRRAVHDGGESAVPQARSRGIGDARRIGKAPPGLQPTVPGTRALPCGDACRGTCHRGFFARRQSEPIASRELACTRGAVPYDRPHRRCRARRPGGREALEPACRNCSRRSACSRTGKSTPPSLSFASTC